jgi:hypothetical protein
MGGGRDNSAHPVSTSGQTASDGDNNVILRVRATIDTLEEDEILRVGDCGGSQGGHRLDDDVGVANDLALRVERLRVGKVRFRRVRERAELDTLGLQGDVETRAGGDGVEVRGALELGCGHVIDGGNGSDRDGVAGASCDLQTIGDGLASAEVDEIVRGCGGGTLAGNRGVLTIVGSLDHRGVKSVG